MKKVLLSAAMLSVLSLQAQTEPAVRQQGAVGINTNEPRATLDVNGDARLQEVQPMAVPVSIVEKFTDCPCVLSLDRYGTVQRIPVNRFAIIDEGSPDIGSISNTTPSQGGGTGHAVMAASQTIYIPSIKDGGIDYQGIIDNGTNKIRFTIPYTSGNSGTYNAVNTTVSSIANAGEENDTNELRLTINSGTFSSYGGNISGIIEVLGDGILNVKKQTLPTSAADFEAKKLEVVSIPFNLGDVSYTLKIVGVNGIPDRCFGKTTKECVGYGADEKEHEFIYTPVLGPDGKTWLSNNLGADYANINSVNFNPAQQATSKDDWRAYGSLFQWQRQPDGHELINWSDATSGSPKYIGNGSASNSWMNAGTNKFIPSVANDAWITNLLRTASTQKDLWKSSGSDKTNPCPLGYHVPTHLEQTTLHNAIMGYNIGTSPSNSDKMWKETGLKLPASGNRYFSSGTLYSQSVYGHMWSSDPTAGGARALYFAATDSGVNDTGNTAYGYSVRCIKD